MSKQKILFIDRDGTLIHEPASKQIDDLEQLVLEPMVIPSLLHLKALGYRMVMVSNQDGLGSSQYPQSQFERVQDKLLTLLHSQGVCFDAVLICPHFENEGCECRKPRLGLVLEYIKSTDWDRTRSYVIGDRDSDGLLAKNMGLTGILYHSQDNPWPSVVAQIENKNRFAKINRKTSETQIELTLHLDQEEFLSIDTGFGFFDHMLEQLARHAGMSLELKATGDVHIDEHHLIEDIGIVIGQGLKQALGDKYGIGRYGFLLPMDEAKTEIALDLSGRPYFVFEGDFVRDSVGSLSTEMIPHFFRSLAFELGACLHLRMQGDNAHHQVESLFKGFGRVFRQAKVFSGSGIPSTKGVL